MKMNWLPWKYVVQRVARARGFVDPVRVLARLHGFAQPSEVAAPLELLRAGVVFHARGLMNSEAIQHNMDWIWPHWIEQQFDPASDAFLPRAFSITHVNLTNRNWTAVGLPDCDELPIVDPRGLLTPFWDGWSIDGWVVDDDGHRLIPSRNGEVTQAMDFDGGLAIDTYSQSDPMASGSMTLTNRVNVIERDGVPVVRQRWTATSARPGDLVLSVRPYNPEGVSFINRIELESDKKSWLIDKHGHVSFSDPADQHFASDYRRGDVAMLRSDMQQDQTECSVGMATAAATFRLEPNVPREIELIIPLDEYRHDHWLRPSYQQTKTQKHSHVAWHDELEGLTQIEIPDQRMQFLHESALRTLVLCMPDEVYPGPYTYKRFWVRDTAFILNAALSVGMHARSEKTLPALFKRQTSAGYFRSQEGEWDSNGQAIWTLKRFADLTGQPIPEDWFKPIRRAADWILKKRINDGEHFANGLLPAGFSAEHLGPNDFYYWDDFWSIAGLRDAADIFASTDPAASQRWREGADAMFAAIQQSLASTDSIRSRHAYPAAPQRRMDAGAIGSVVATYPLQLVTPDDNRFQGTLDFLCENCLYKGGFFQDMIHSGINPYLTLHLAQAWLRKGDPRWFDYLNCVAELASPTGQWPEAIHPRTLGGCMGDGQHSWAAAEWLMALRNMFVREEGDRLLIGTGVPSHWLKDGNRLSYGPTWTPWGKIAVTFECKDGEVQFSWTSKWHGEAPSMRVELVGCDDLEIDATQSRGSVTIPLKDVAVEVGS